MSTSKGCLAAQLQVWGAQPQEAMLGEESRTGFAQGAAREPQGTDTPSLREMRSVPVLPSGLPFQGPEEERGSPLGAST